MQYNWRVYTAALVISMGVLAYGYDSAFIGTTITHESFKRDFGLVHMTTAEKNNVTSNITSICASFNVELNLYFYRGLTFVKTPQVVS
jgi:hypothetical protein